MKLYKKIKRNLKKDINELNLTGPGFDYQIQGMCYTHKRIVRCMTLQCVTTVLLITSTVVQNNDNKEVIFSFHLEVKTLLNIIT